MSTSSYYCAIQEEGFGPFKPSTVQVLSENDFNKRMEFCEIMLSKFEENSNLLHKIIWSDESQFMLNGIIHCHNCCYWAYSNQHKQIPNSKNRGWCGILSGGLIGPYFFNILVTGDSYLQMLEEFSWPQVKQRGMYFQQDRPSGHYSCQVRSWLDQKFPQ